MNTDCLLLLLKLQAMAINLASDEKRRKGKES